MKYPRLYTKQNSRQMVDSFKGYNHNLRIGDGEFFDMKNMTSDYYPVLSPRGQRGVYVEGRQYTGMIAKDALCHINDGTLFINEEPVDGLVLRHDAEPKQLISMGAYIIILPDKKWFNTADGSYGNIEAFFPGVENQVVNASYEMCKVDGSVYTGVVKGDAPPENPKDTPLWIDTSSTPHALKQYSETSAVWSQIATTYIKISAPGIAAPFNQYDAVKITGFPENVNQLKELDGQMFPLWDVYHDPGNDERAEGTNDYIVIVGLLDEAVTYESYLQIERTMPIMDFVIESGNRLWGCHYGIAANGEVVNEIYCSKLGDFKNWSCYMGISTDSWAASIGTDGQFTGAITHLGYPIFFKENYMHKVYGNYPANFQIQTTACSGVQKGCHKSLAIVNTTLFYKGRSGVCAYDGSLPVVISHALGNEVYGDSVGGACGNKYYISMEKGVNGDYNLFVFDVAKSMWHKEDDDLHVSAFCSCDGDLYAIVGGDKIITMLGSGEKDTEPVEWMVETGDIGLSSPDMKYISRLTVRMSMEIGAEVRFYAQYDYSDEWEQLCTLTGEHLRSFSLPIRPKRCDHMRLRIEGVGVTKIYSITKTIEQGSELS